MECGKGAFGMGVGIPKSTTIGGKAGGGTGSSAWGKGGNDLERRRRTVYFGKFQEEKGEDIINLVKQWTDGFNETIEAIYSFGKFGDPKKGAARFRSEGEMWEFMTKNRGKLRYQVGDKTIYANIDISHDPNPDRSKAVNKVVRLLIDKHGGVGDLVKPDIETNYPKGLVGFKKVRIAEWDEDKGEMRLLEEAQAWEEDYRKMMEKE